MSIAPHHLDYLDKHAIRRDVAEAVGIRSILSADDAPGWFISDAELPGLMFPHPQMIGGGVIEQYRPDTPPPGAPKYRTLPGEAIGFSVDAASQAILESDETYTLLLTEGTAQTFAARSNLPDDGKYVVAGIAGCRGWQTGGIAHPDMPLLLLPTCKRVIVVLDADMSTNHAVWSAAKALAAAIPEEADRKVPVTFARLPGDDTGEATLGLDDYLALYPEHDRARRLLGLITRAENKLGRAPKKKPKRTMKSSLPVVDDKRDIILHDQYEDDDGSLVDGRMIAGFSARAKKRIVVLDDLDADVPPVVYHDVEVSYGGEESGDLRERHIISQVPDADLGRPRDWLMRTPDAVGSTYYVEPAASGMIGEAIRDHRSEDTEVQTWRPRTGIGVVHGTVGYVHADGAITPDGHNDTVRAKTSTSAKHIAYPAVIDPEELARCARITAVDMPHWLRSPEIIHALIGSMSYAAASLRPGHAVWLGADPGAGKTGIARGIMSFQSPEWAHDAPLISAVSTESGIEASLNGYHNAFVVLDDVKNRTTHKAQAQQDAAVDACARRSYDGNTKSRATYSDDGRLSLGATDRSTPLVVITAEGMPDAMQERSQSERYSALRLTRRDTFYDPDNPDADYLDGESPTYTMFLAAAREGTYNLAWAGYLRWLVTRIAAMDDDPAQAIRQWYAEMDRSRAAISATVARLLDSDDPRLAAVPATVIAGYALWVEYLTDIEVLDQRQAMKMTTEMKHNYLRRVRDYHDVVLGGDASSPVEVLLAKLRDAVAGREYGIVSQGGAEPAPGQTLLGGRKTHAGVEYVAMIPSVIGKITRMSGSKACQVLAGAGVIREGSSGRPVRQTRIGGGTPTDCVWVRWDAFAPETDDDNDNDNEDY